ncbi:MAG: UrcA family protein [Sphingobium sp.]|nr:MAG: UrcA family protein [Sphingobium sp.]
MFARKITTPFTATLAATLCLAAATPAFAETFESNGRQTEVRYNDLDLTTHAGQRALRKRINFAASQVCAHYDAATMNICRQSTLRHLREPIATVIAAAETRARYADAAGNRVQVGN